MRHADDVLNIGAAGNLRKPVLHQHQNPDERPGADADERAERDIGDRLLEIEFARRAAWRRPGTAKAGSGPISTRPSSVAAPVATTTGRKVRLETSGSRISSANNTPPSGVLKVAAIPAPAPAATSVIFCEVVQPERLRKRRTQRRADLDDRPLAPDRRARADRQRGGQRLDDRDKAANVAAAIEDRVHHLRHAVAFGLRRETPHEKHDDETAEDRRQERSSRRSGLRPPARWRRRRC